MTYDLPPGWALATIGDVADVQLGRQRSPQHHAGDHMRPYLRAANVTWKGFRLEDVKEMNFDDSDFETYKLEPGDILLNEASGSPNEVGKPAVWRGEIDGCCFQNTLLKLRARAIDVGYLYWYCLFSALTGRFGEAGRGVNIRHLGKQGLMGFPIAVAPRTQQERIVAAIEEHFSRLDAVDSGLAAAILRTTQLQQHVVDDQLRLADARSQPLSGFLTERLANGRSVPTAASSGDPVLRLTALKDGFIDPSEMKRGDFGDTDPRRFAIAPDDFLISRGNGSLQLVGRGGLVLKDAPAVAFPDTMIRARVDKSRLSPQYLSLVWHSRQVRRQLETQARTTAGIYKVNQSMIGAVEFPVPPLDVQHQLVQVLEETRQVVKSTAASLNRCQARSSALRRAVLAEAFAGRLVSQSSGDESASDMLERMGASAR